MYRKSQNILNDLTIALVCYLFLPAITKSCDINVKWDMEHIDSNEVNGSSIVKQNQNGFFYYFAFGSNMLTKRIHVGNPTAVSLGAGFLKNYRLDFNIWSPVWHGNSATIVPTEGAAVYGTIWKIGYCNLKNLDIQESVELGLYIPLCLPIVALNNDTIIECRSYALTNQPDTDLRDFTPDTTPSSRQPSKSYLKTIIKGAIETGLPAHYINWLRTLKHNGNLVEEFEQTLDLSDELLRM